MNELKDWYLLLKKLNLQEVYSLHINLKRFKTSIFLISKIIFSFYPNTYLIFSVWFILYHLFFSILYSKNRCNYILNLLKEIYIQFEGKEKKVFFELNFFFQAIDYINYHFFYYLYVVRRIYNLFIIITILYIQLS